MKQTHRVVVALLAGVSASALVACSSATGPSTTDTTPAVTEKGTATGTATTATLGAAGGQLSSSDGGLTIVVPVGALAASTQIGIQPITNLAPGGFGTGYRLTPDGQLFSAPVQLVFDYQDTDLLGSPLVALGVAYQDDKGRWHSLKSVSRDAAAHKTTVTTTHFTDWTRELGFHIEPPSASVEPGQAVELRLIECHTFDLPGDPDVLSSLVGTCGPSREPLIWTVNGVKGGNATNGTVTDVSPGVVNYTAPAATPVNNPVAVSGDAFDPVSKILVVSNIDVGGHGVWVGTVSVDMTFAQAGLFTSTTKIRASVTWEYSAAAGYFRPQGNFSYDYDATGLTYSPPCKTTAHYSAAIAFEDGNLTLSGQTFYGSGGKTSAPITQISDCNDSRTSETTSIPGPVLWWPGGTGSVSANGKTIEGSGSAPTGFGTDIWTWKFTKQ